MRPFLTLVIVLILTALVAPVSHAQRDTIAPPVGGVETIYVETPIEALLYTELLLNVCAERFFTLNPRLKPNQVLDYGLPIKVPISEDCYSFNRKPFVSISRMKYFEGNQWLQQPYYNDLVAYLYFHQIPDTDLFGTYGGFRTTFLSNIDVTDIYSYQSIAENSLGYCLEDLLPENYLWQIYSLEELSFIGRFSIPAFLPYDYHSCESEYFKRLQRHEPNPPRIVALNNSQNLPAYFRDEFNICHEEINYAQWDLTGYASIQYPDHIYQIRLPSNTINCYNDDGKRLRYFDDEGNRLLQPIYSDLPVYHVPPNTTWPEIAQRYGSCLIDLLRLNNFVDLPIGVDIDILIPPQRTCPNDLIVEQISRTDLSIFPYPTVLCHEEVDTYNPHINISYHERNRLVADLDQKIWIIRPINGSQNCYREVPIYRGETVYDIEKRINVCHEVFLWLHQEGHPYNVNLDANESVYHHIDALPCYDENGHRLQYIRPNRRTFSPFGVESGFPAHGWLDFKQSVGLVNPSSHVTEYRPVHIMGQGEYVYDISRRYNVCVHDLINLNPVLIDKRKAGAPIFIPENTPCYHPLTGQQFISAYGDDGFGLTDKVSPYVIHYQFHQLASVYMSYYYNVCINHIEDANRAKLDGEISYLGWIIPTDRPPCYTGNGSRIDYACYAQNGLDAACFDDYSPNRFTLHTIGTGESLSSIAGQYGVEVWEITWANRLDMRQPLWPNQTLIIPKQSTSAQVYALVLGTFVSLLLVAGLIIPLARQTRNRD